MLNIKKFKYLYYKNYVYKKNFILGLNVCCLEWCWIMVLFLLNMVCRLIIKISK